MSNAVKWNKAVDAWASYGQGKRKVGDGTASLRTCTAAAHAAEKHADVARLHAVEAGNQRKAAEFLLREVQGARLAAEAEHERAQRCWRWAVGALVLALGLDLLLFFLLTP